MGQILKTEWAAQTKISVEGSAASAIPATIPETGRELQFFAHLSNGCNLSHEISLRRSCRGSRDFLFRFSFRRFERNTE